MAHEAILHFGSGDIFTAPADDILLTASKEEEPIAVKIAHISRENPAVLVGLCCFLRIVLVTQGHTRPVDNDLTDLFQGQALAPIINDPDLVTRQW